MAQRLKHLPAMQETWVRSLGREGPLEKEMATHSSILAWRIPWTEELGGLQSTGSQRVDTTERLHFHFQGCILSPCLFNLYAEYIMRKSGLDEHGLESRLLGEMPITSEMQMTPPLRRKVKKN